jgi:3-isopropylmalate/(R)-2-methylmalate dehydratase large subunit
MTGQTITEKILARAAGKERVVPGETIDARIDTLMMHDVTSSGAIKLLKKEFGNKVAEGLEIVVTPDHYVPNKDIASAILYQELKTFVGEQQAAGAKICAYMVEGGDYGVCHVMVPEKGHVLPGQVIVGGDSHTCTYGALGAFSTGIGTTEAGNVLATGRLWFRVPESFLFKVDGEMPKNVMAKDLFLRVVGEIGVDGALYQAMEWQGPVISKMSMDERMTLTNMAIEAGAKSGIIVPDDTTIDYLVKKVPPKKLDSYITESCGGGMEAEIQSDPDAQYARTMKVDASSLEPLVACPDLPSNVRPARELQDVRIDQAYIGGCTGGKWEDFVAAAKVLEGKRVAKGVRLLIVPSTADIQRRLVKEGLYDTFMDAGAVFSAPTCGACLGGYMGILAPGEVSISSTNRNFRGRMGDPESRVYLASPKTVAASAIAGHIVGAEK